MHISRDSKAASCDHGVAVCVLYFASWLDSCPFLHPSTSAKHTPRWLRTVNWGMQLLLLFSGLAATITNKPIDRRKLSETRTLELIALHVKDPAGQRIIFKDCTEKNVRDWWHGSSSKCRDNRCLDTVNWVDAMGYKCTSWLGSTCSNKYGAERGYSIRQMVDVRKNCRLSCVAYNIKPTIKQWHGICEECREVVCSDTPNWLDAEGYTCTDWIGSECTNDHGIRQGYTANQMRAVRRNCRLSCASSCLKSSVKQWYEVCQNCRDNTCADTANWVDGRGHKCTDWMGYDCTNDYGAEHGYSQEQMSDVRGNCRLSCSAACRRPGAKEWFDHVFRGMLTWDVRFHTATINNFLREGECAEKYRWDHSIDVAVDATKADPESDHVLLFAPPNWESNSCGRSELPAGGGVGSENGRNAFTDRACGGSAYHWSTAVHEIGHNLGLSHAGTSFEGDRFLEYGECGSIMGESTGSWMSGLNAPHMSQKGLLFAGESKIASDGKYTLNYLYHPTQGKLRVLRFFDDNGNAVMFSYRWKTPSFPYTQHMDRCFKISGRISVHRHKDDTYTHLTNLIDVGQSITIDGVSIHFVFQDGKGAAVVRLTGLKNRHIESCKSFVDWPHTVMSCNSAKHCIHLVNATKYNTCNDYCASIPGDHTCFYAAEDYRNLCVAEVTESCGANINKFHETRDMLCGCTSSAAAQRKVQICNPYVQWPNTFKSCSSVKQCVHLVEASVYRSCNHYCASLPGSHTCFYAAEDTADKICSVKSKESCDTNIHEKYRTSDMLCGCTMGSKTITTVKKTKLICPACGTMRKSGTRSCCVRGGAWFQKCGDAGDRRFEYTWTEGIQACKGLIAANSITVVAVK